MGICGLSWTFMIVWGPFNNDAKKRGWGGSKLIENIEIFFSFLQTTINFGCDL